MGRKSNYEFLVEAGLQPVNAQVLYWLSKKKEQIINDIIQGIAIKFDELYRLKHRLAVVK